MTPSEEMLAKAMAQFRTWGPYAIIINVLCEMYPNDRKSLIMARICAALDGFGYYRESSPMFPEEYAFGHAFAAAWDEDQLSR
jgi:hypothetical protein